MSDEASDQVQPVLSRYSIVIQWSDEDQACVVGFPEFEALGHYFLSAHGNTYAEAAESAQELLDELLIHAQEGNWPLPAPQKYPNSASEPVSA
jgi:antitoxin HicB